MILNHFKGMVSRGILRGVLGLRMMWVNVLLMRVPVICATNCSQLLIFIKMILNRIAMKAGNLATSSKLSNFMKNEIVS